MEINYARLHSPTFVPGLGTVRETLDKTQFSELSMQYVDAVLKVTASKPGLPKKVTFLVPLASVALMTAPAGE